MAKENLVVHIRKLFFKTYMKNHKIYFFKQSRGEENNRRRAHTSTQIKKEEEEEVCTTLIVFMINLANLEINYQFLSLTLSWTSYRDRVSLLIKFGDRKSVV